MKKIWEKWDFYAKSDCTNQKNSNLEKFYLVIKRKITKSMYFHSFKEQLEQPQGEKQMEKEENHSTIEPNPKLSIQQIQKRNSLYIRW